ncbi:large ribosomal subunit protein mL55 isoform X3 [Callithrix jacchus]
MRVFVFALVSYLEVRTACYQASPQRQKRPQAVLRSLSVIRPLHSDRSGEVGCTPGPVLTTSTCHWGSEEEWRQWVACLGLCTPLPRAAGETGWLDRPHPLQGATAHAGDAHRSGHPDS